MWVGVGSVTCSLTFGIGAVACGIAIAATNSSWNLGSVAVSILTTSRTACSISARSRRESSACTAPVPAALPTARTLGSAQSGTSPRIIARSGSMWAPNAPARRMSEIGGDPACSTSRSIPARSAAFASWMARMSFCVTATTCPVAWSVWSTYENVRPSATMRGDRAANSPRMTPSRSMIPARNISATTSMMPEPQIPVMPVAATAVANVSSSLQTSAPITLRRGSSVSASMRTPSIAPAVARCPALIWAPSNAGPVGLDAANCCRESPSTISAFVPMSTSNCMPSPRCGPSARIAAAVSAPT